MWNTPFLTLLAISNHFSWPKYFVLFYQKPWGIWNQGSQFFLKVVEAGGAIFVAKDDVLMMCSFYQKKKKSSVERLCIANKMVPSTSRPFGEKNWKKKVFGQEKSGLNPLKRTDFFPSSVKFAYYIGILKVLQRTIVKRTFRWKSAPEVGDCILP